MKKKRWVIYIVIWVLVVVLHVVAWNSQAFCDWYIANLFPVWVNTYGRLTGLFPFSVGEMMIVLGVILVVFALLLGISWGVASLIRKCILQRRQKNIEPVAYKRLNMLSLSLAKQEKVRKSRGWRGFQGFCKGFYAFFAWILLLLAIVMTLNCFVLYHASTFSEKYFGKDEETYTLEDLTALRNFIVEQCNSLSGQMDRDENGFVNYQGNMAEVAKAAMRNLGESYGNLSGYYPSPKPLLSSDFMSQQYMAGYYFPFSMEANYNDVMYLLNWPSTFCHELAHLRGYIYEDEANFIGYLACVESEDLFFQYSGYLSVLGYVDRDFYNSIGQDREAYLAEVAILPQVYEDDIFLLQEEWDRIEGSAILDTELVDQVSDAFTDTTLKLNGVSDGMASYSRVVGLLLQYYKNVEQKY